MASTMNKAKRESDLIEGYLEGERAAYDALNSWITAVLNLRSWHNSIREARDDIRQEVLTALVKNFRQNKYKGKGLKTYVSSVTKYTCLKAYDRTVHVDDSQADPPSDEPSALEGLVEYEKLSEVRSAVKQLSFKCRKMLALRFYNDMSHNNIASRLGITVETSRQWLKRCLDKLRSLAGGTNRL